MKNHCQKIKGLILFSSLFCFFQIYGQSSDCKVLIPEISGNYVGDCKNGLAHGMGTATGIDRYEGQFSKGLPNGTGTYTWAHGIVYKGQWSKGIRHGEGEMVYTTVRGDSTVKGFWRGGTYIGTENTPSFIVNRKDDLLSTNFRRLGDGNEVIVKFMMKGQKNSNVRGLTMAFTSGVQFKSGTYEGVESVNFPLELKISYTTNNPISRSSFDVVFECTINEPGKWEITLNH